MRVAIVGVVCWLCLVTPARGEPGSAREHFLAGLQLYQKGQYAAALDEYRVAWVTWHDPELLLDMAECNRHLGNIAEARRLYVGFLQREPRSPLRSAVERQLARLDDPSLAPPPAELAPSAPAPSLSLIPRAAEPPPSTAGRTAKIAGIIGWATSAVAVGVGIYSYAEMRALESKTHNELIQIAAANPAVRYQNVAFFSNPGCSPPSSLVGTDAYRRDCNRGTQFAAAADALAVVGGLVGLAGTIAYVVGARQSARAHERPSVTPFLGASGGGVIVRF
jgi:hypothetical protein